MCMYISNSGTGTGVFKLENNLYNNIIIFRGHNFVQNTRAIIYNDCAHVRTRMRILIVVLRPHPQPILRGVVCETNVAATCNPLRSIS